MRIKFVIAQQSSKFLLEIESSVISKQYWF
jgi:hypothetical protein